MTKPFLLTPEIFWGHVTKTEECWIWKAYIPWRRNHYGTVCVDGINKLPHRVAWEFTNGIIPKGMQVLHHCDIPRCVRPDHLFLGTRSDNMKDCWRKGRHPSGGRAGKGKSGVPYVAWDRFSGKWRAQIHRPLPIFLGNYKTIGEARLVVERYRSKI